MSTFRFLTLALLGAVPFLASCATESATPPVPEVTVIVPVADRVIENRLSPDGTQLAVSQVVEGRSGIWVRHSDGSNPVRLTTGVWDNSPVWSPDGKWIAYQAESPNFDIMVVSVDGGEARQLTKETALERPIAWLPDGSGVVYLKLGDGLETRVVMLSDGSTRPLVTADGAVEAQPSPDGKKVAYELTRDGKTTIWVWDSATNEHKQLTFEGREGMDEGLAWSPDGSSLLFRSSRTGTPDLWIGDLASGQLRQLTSDIQPDFSGRWSPDGQWVAFLSGRGGQTDLWVAPSAGGEPIRVTDDLAIERLPEWTADGGGLIFGTNSSVQQVRLASVDGGEAQLLSFADYPAGNPRLSPDGSAILFVSNRSGNDDIWMVPTAGGDPRPLTSSALGDNSPDWAPDGKSIAFESNRRGSSDVYVMSDTGGEARLLVDWPQTGEGNAQFSPDGRTIAFISNRDARTRDVWTVPIDGGTPTRLTRFDSFTELEDWSPDGRYLLIRTGTVGGALYRVPLAGGAAQRLAAPPGSDFHAWSPDGSQIAYANVIGGYAYLEVLPIAGGQPRRLTTEERSYDVSARWSPDGKQLVFDSFDLPNSTEDIVVVNVADGTARKVTATPDIGERGPRWTPDGRHLVFTYAWRGTSVVTANVAGLLAKARDSAAGQK